LVARSACPAKEVDDVEEPVVVGSDDDVDVVVGAVFAAADVAGGLVARVPAVAAGLALGAVAALGAGTPLAPIVTRTSGSRTKLGLTAHPPGLLRCRRKVRAGSLVAWLMMDTGNDCFVSFVKETVRLSGWKSWPALAVSSIVETST
jgi:hypothetical protein